MKKNKLVLYQYQPISSSGNLDHLINYATQRVWFNQISKFNDPFEGAFTYLPIPSQDIIDNPSQSNEISFMQKKEIRDFYQNHGAFCLTRSSTNIPMWAHYANNHNGYCLIFEINYELIQSQLEICDADMESYISDFENGKDILSFYGEKNLRFVITKVNYQNHPPEIKEHKLKKIQSDFNGHPYELTKYVVQNSIAIKHIDWEYEKEFRVICNTTGQKSGLCDLRKYAPFIKVTGIILGQKIDPLIKMKIQTDVYDWAYDLHPITIYESKLSQTQYLIDKTLLFNTNDKGVEA